MPDDAKDQNRTPFPATEEQPPRARERSPGLKDGSVVDEYIDDSFPASDPPSFTPGTGSGAPDETEKDQKPAKR